MNDSRIVLGSFTMEFAMMYLLLLLAVFFPALAFAQDVPTESVDSLVNLLIEAVRSEQWLVVAGVATTLIVIGIRRTGVLAQVPVKYMPWVAIAIAVVSSIATSLISGVTLITALTQGIIVGTAASGFWEMIFKHVTLPTIPKQ